MRGDYAKGVSILADLYVDTGDPNHLFNQARCYEQNLRFVEAAERFKEYPRKAPRLGEAERTDVEKHIQPTARLLVEPACHPCAMKCWAPWPWMCGIGIA